MALIKLNLLKVKQIKEDRVWLLAEGNLYEYLNSLKPKFYEYAIQRKIVKNDYLDKLLSTIIQNEPLPIITLTTESEETYKEGDVAEIESNQIEILDGLQRTFRLWAHLKLYESFANSQNQGNNKEFITEFKGTEFGPLFFELGIFKTSYIRKLILGGELAAIREKFTSYNLYFYLWLNLSEIEVVNKMLMLNLGQKSVSAQHQFELLFLHFYRHFVDEVSKIKIIRERDLASKLLKGENRVIGHFLFSSVIIAMLSLYESKAKRVNKKELGFEINDDSDLNAPLFQLLFDKEFIESFLSSLYEIDSAISQSYSNIGIKWFGKDTTLSGVYAGISEFIDVTEILKSIDDEIQEEIDFKSIRLKLKEETKRGANLFIDKVKAKELKLDEFESAYEQLSSRSINIGSVLRKAIKEFTVKLLEGQQPNWADYLK